ncbi:uncharacterized protein LOC126318655 [Schistocerca gregaria]|uniref:uncharacterized protein LOC126318655 n=1 Tax=Schistocerca gregaria TaxID=7010 RepID=UPI00211E3FE2|nr:uncharacterized protein LOC126318655 [Schistocerca gregaria]
MRMLQDKPSPPCCKVLMKESDWNLAWIQARKDCLSRAPSSIPSDHIIFTDGDVPFILYLAKNLQKKPKSFFHNYLRSGDDSYDPFLHPSKNPLYIGSPNDDYSILLNKFNLVENHLVVVTENPESQLDPLKLADFEILWKCVSRLNMIGFYNCGPLSGASVSHKHMQFIPLPDIRELAEMNINLPIEKLIQRDSLDIENAVPFINRKIPFYNYCFQFNSNDVPQETIIKKTYEAYVKIMDSVTKNLSLTNTTPSYNFLLTKRWMLVVPRSQAHYENSDLSINSLAFSGSLFVKNMYQYNSIRHLGPMNVLKRVTFPHLF